MPARSEGEEAQRSQPPHVPISANELVQVADLVDVRATEISATSVDGPSRSSVDKVEFEVTPYFAAAPGVYGNKFEFRFGLLADSGELVGEIRFTLVVDYRVPPDYEPDTEAASFVSDTTGFFAAYPYARELFDSLVVRLRLDPLVLGLLQRGTMTPRGIGSIRIGQANGDDGAEDPEEIDPH